MLKLYGHSSTVYSLVFTPDGSTLYSGAKDGLLSAWDEMGDPRPVAVLPDSVNVNQLSVDPSGVKLAIGCSDSWRVASLDSPDKSVPLVAVTGGVTAIHFVDQELLAIGYGHRVKPEPGRLELFHLATGMARTPKIISAFGVRALATHAASRRVAWSEWGGQHQHGPRLSVIELHRPDPVKLPVARTPLSLAFHPDGHLLGAAVEWGFSLFDLERKQEKFAVRGHKGTVTSLVISPDGRTLATGSWDGTVKFWDTETGAERRVFDWRIGKIFSLAYSPDGLRIAAGSDSGAVMLWDAE